MDTVCKAFMWLISIPLHMKIGMIFLYIHVRKLIKYSELNKANCRSVFVITQVYMAQTIF